MPENDSRGNHSRTHWKQVSPFHLYQEQENSKGELHPVLFEALTCWQQAYLGTGHLDLRQCPHRAALTRTNTHRAELCTPKEAGQPPWAQVTEPAASPWGVCWLAASLPQRGRNRKTKAAGKEQEHGRWWKQLLGKLHWNGVFTKKKKKNIYIYIYIYVYIYIYIFLLKGHGSRSLISRNFY